MFTLQDETIPGVVQHIVECFNIWLASELLEAALRHDFYVEADDENPRRVTVFFVTESELDTLLVEARHAYNQRPLPIAAP